jgi:hypothetical protein
MTESDTSKPRAQPETRPGIPLVWHADDREGLSDENRVVVDEVARLIKAGIMAELLVVQTQVANA